MLQAVRTLGTSTNGLAHHGLTTKEEEHWSEALQPAMDE